ncbi:hypothetical protein DFH08DRAFT_871268 [Mycena albidolilacea]|uniref:Uncharacterized protein n=1 Tax=Mycena albidolilacea TaxID=1033008 RepID=A0AAD7EQJ1_9AGAR|nr:hypothetical protein DFH08DRAFT_871268 [Mycena albidolilacea]
MTRFSTTFFVAAVAASLLQANAAPLQLHARAEDVTPNFTQDSQCANSEIVASLLSSALAVLDQAKTKDNAVANDLATLKVMDDSECTTVACRQLTLSF